MNPASTPLFRPDLDGLPQPDEAARQAVAERASQVLRPGGALERLDNLAVWLAGWQRNAAPDVVKPAVALFVGSHGVATERVSAYPATINREMLQALRAGKATAAVMARQLGAPLRVVDAGIDEPTGNLAREPALTAQRFAAAWRLGQQTVATLDCDILVVGEMGIANTTAAAATCAALFGGDPGSWTGRGTGIGDAALERKIGIVTTATRRIASETDPFEILRQVGGAEMVALCSAVLAARRRSLPVILDGFVVGAAVAPLHVAGGDALAHCLAGHVSAEAGHHRLLARLGIDPLLDLGMRLGEASGALVAMAVLRVAAACVREVATFSEWEDAHR